MAAQLIHQEQLLQAWNASADAEKRDVAGGRHPSITPTHGPNPVSHLLKEAERGWWTGSLGQVRSPRESSHQLSACLQSRMSIIHARCICYPDGGPFPPFTSLLLFPDCMII